jgi:hypothetical protein
VLDLFWHRICARALVRVSHRNVQPVKELGRGLGARIARQAGMRRDEKINFFGSGPALTASGPRVAISTTTRGSVLTTWTSGRAMHLSRPCTSRR